MLVNRAFYFLKELIFVYTKMIIKGVGTMVRCAGGIWEFQVSIFYTNFLKKKTMNTSIYDFEIHIYVWEKKPLGFCNALSSVMTFQVAFRMLYQLESVIQNLFIKLCGLILKQVFWSFTPLLFLSTSTKGLALQIVKTCFSLKCKK